MILIFDSRTLYRSRPMLSYGPFLTPRRLNISMGSQSVMFQNTVIVASLRVGSALAK
jgi:hypothetical protein